MEEMTKQMKQAAADQAEFEEKIKSPMLHVLPSVISHVPLTAVFWPLDVIKNHMLAGKKTTIGTKNQYSFKGVGYGIAGATLLGMDISKVYVENFCEKRSFFEKAAIGLMPLTLVPLGSMIDLLKINSQVSQLSMKQCWAKIIQTNGYKGLFRGLIPYTSLFLLTYSAVLLPLFYLQKPSKGIPGFSQGEPDTVQLNPLLILSYFLISTPIDMIKTRAMLGDTITLNTLRTIPLKSYATSFAVRTCYVLLFGLLVSKGIEISTLVAYSTKTSRYMERKKVDVISKSFADDSEFDDLIPEDTDDLKEMDILKKAISKDG